VGENHVLPEPARVPRPPALLYHAPWLGVLGGSGGRLRRRKARIAALHTVEHGDSQSEDCTWAPSLAGLGQSRPAPPHTHPVSGWGSGGPSAGGSEEALSSPSSSSTALSTSAGMSGSLDQQRKIEREHRPRGEGVHTATHVASDERLSSPSSTALSTPSAMTLAQERTHMKQRE
jgi:hypothetical protein